MCIGPEKGLIHLPLAQDGSLSHLPDSDQQIFNASLGLILSTFLTL
jgi:hypothetical protein